MFEILFKINFFQQHLILKLVNDTQLTNINRRNLNVRLTLSSLIVYQNLHSSRPSLLFSWSWSRTAQFLTTAEELSSFYRLTFSFSSTSPLICLIHHYVLISSLNHSLLHEGWDLNLRTIVDMFNSSLCSHIISQPLTSS